MARNIVLASKSKRRRTLLSTLGLSVKVLDPDVDETLQTPDISPKEFVATLASRKALSAWERLDRHDGTVVIAADTVVCYDGIIFGKPEDKTDAFNTLSVLSGEWHEVYTGFAVKSEEKLVCDYEVSRVKFREISADELEEYIESGEPMDKAGAYGIQERGGIFVERIEGDYFNIVGLPLCRLSVILREEFGINLLSNR